MDDRPMIEVPSLTGPVPHWSEMPKAEQWERDKQRVLRGSLTGLAIGLVMLGLSLLLMVVL